MLPIVTGTAVNATLHIIRKSDSKNWGVGFGGERMKAPQTPKNETVQMRKWAENHFPMSVYLLKSIHPVRCQGKLRLLFWSEEGSLSTWHLPKMENVTPSAYHRTPAPGKRTPHLLPVQHPAFPFSPLAEGALGSHQGHPQEQVSLGPCGASLCALPSI